MTTTETAEARARINVTEALWASINRWMEYCAARAGTPAQGYEFRWVPFEPNEARARYAAIPETSTEGSRWYVWKSGDGPNYIGGKIASKADAERIAAELNMLASLTPPAQGGVWNAAIEAAIGLFSKPDTPTFGPSGPRRVKSPEQKSIVAKLRTLLRSTIPDASPGSGEPQETAFAISRRRHESPSAPTAERLRSALERKAE